LRDRIKIKATVHRSLSSICLLGDYIDSRAFEKQIKESVSCQVSDRIGGIHTFSGESKEMMAEAIVVFQNNNNGD
jgi:hypothetical protein